VAPTHQLFDVDPIAITICKKGANGQRIFLKKSSDDDELVTLPAQHTILKSGDDWRVFYCVVAEPGAEEDCGMGDDAGTGIVDVWKSEEEIAAAAHRLLKNKGYVNAMHDALAAEGCAIVENAVALSDIWVGDTSIKKGSWYVGIEPSPEFREQVDAGEITGVSLEGTGFREALIQKADKSPDVKIPNKPGKTNWLERRGGFPSYMRKVIEDILGSNPQYLATAAGVSRAISIGVGVVKNWKDGHDGKGNKVSAATVAKARKAWAEWEKKKSGGSVKKELLDIPAEELAQWSSRLLKQMAERTLLQKVADKLGIESGPDFELVAIAKETPTFAASMAARELEDELPAAFDVLRSCIWRAFYPYGDEAPDDPKVHVAQSLGEFQSWAIDLLGRVGGEDKAKVAKALGVDPDRLPDPGVTVEDEVDNDTAQKLLKASEEQTTALNNLVQAITDGKLVSAKTVKTTDDADEGDEGGKKVKKTDADGDTPLTKADLRKAMDELLVEMATGVSAQPDEDGAEKKIEKSDDPLKGLLS
jgi:hypothetical protein